MSFFDSLLISFLGLGLVFVVLVGLSAVITIESKVFDLLRKKAKKETADHSTGSSGENIPLISAGELMLFEVDEKTAAMIMAIVSDESGIPLSELQFKSIKALD